MSLKCEQDIPFVQRTEIRYRVLQSKKTKGNRCRLEYTSLIKTPNIVIEQ